MAQARLALEQLGKGILDFARRPALAPTCGSIERELGGAQRVVHDEHITGVQAGAGAWDIVREKINDAAYLGEKSLEVRANGGGAAKLRGGDVHVMVKVRSIVTGWISSAGSDISGVGITKNFDEPVFIITLLLIHVG